MPGGSTGAYGQLTPEDGNSDLSTTAFIVRQMMAYLDTIKLVKVIAVHGGGGAIAAAGTVDVQPLVNQIDGATPPNATPHGRVYGIPWFRLQGGLNAVICDPQVGDLGYVSCADRDISVVKSTSAVGNPGSLRRHNIADGIYVGGCISQGVPNQYMAFTAAGIAINAAAGNTVTIQIGGTTVAQFSSSGLAVTGKITSTQDTVAGAISVQNHVHTGVQTGGSNTGPATG